MLARWEAKCGKCHTTIAVGDPIKAQFVRVGFDSDSGKPIWQRVPKSYVHAPKCPKVTRKVDYTTGEVT